MISSAHAFESKLPVRRIGFAGDFLRFSIGKTGYSSSQTRNIAWLRELITGARRWPRRDVGAEVIAPIDGLAMDFEADGATAAAIEEYRCDAELAWARRYDTTTPDVLPALFDALTRYDLIVGFELSPTIKRHLNAHSIRYVSFHVHALRMLRDLCLGATTNCPSIARKLATYVVPPAEVESQIRRFRALCKFRALPAFALPRGVPVLIGQTERDSILIENGKFGGWPDQLPLLEQVLDGFDAVVVIEHPYRPDSRGIAETLRGQLGKTVISTNGNGYATLFSNPDIPLAVTLASSLGVESQAMGIPTHFLLGDPRQRLRVKDIDLGPDGPLGHEVFSDAFWGPTLGLPMPSRSRARDADCFALGEGYIRASLDSWSYGLLQRGLAGASTTRRTIYPASRLPESRLGHLLAELAGTAGGSATESAPETMLREQGITQTVAAQPLSLGETCMVDFSQPASMLYLGKGFHPAEPWGAWTSEPKAQLRVALAAEAVREGAELDVTLTLRVYEGVLGRCPVVRIVSAGNVLGYAFFRPTTPGFRALRFRLLPTQSLCEIDLEVSDLERPAAISNQADSRLLGIALGGLKLVCHAGTGKPIIPSPPFLDVGEQEAVRDEFAQDEVCTEAQP